MEDQHVVLEGGIGALQCNGMSEMAALPIPHPPLITCRTSWECRPCPLGTRHAGAGNARVRARVRVRVRGTKPDPMLLGLGSGLWLGLGLGFRLGL